MVVSGGVTKLAQADVRTAQPQTSPCSPPQTYLTPTHATTPTPTPLHPPPHSTHPTHTPPAPNSPAAHARWPAP